MQTKKELTTAKKKKSKLFYIGYAMAVLAWFSFSSFYGVEMISPKKMQDSYKQGGSYSSIYHK